MKKIQIHCANDEMVSISELKPNPRNPNRHPQRQIELLAKIIREQGWRAPITVSQRSGFVVRGHGRLLAAQLLGCETVPVDRQSYASDADELADMVADNRIAELAEIDDELLSELIGDLTSADIDMELTGFDVEAMDSSYLIETINRPNGERAGSSPWDRIAKASDGVVFQFGDLTKRVPESLYKRFRDNISQDKVEVWLDANLDH